LSVLQYISISTENSA